MKDYLEEIILKCSDLYDMYESYLWKHDDSNLEVLIQDNTLCYYLYKNKELYDEIILTFDEKEKGIYAYICIRMIIHMLGNVTIYVNENELYNNVHKSYLKVIVNDEGILDSILRIIKYQDVIVIHGKMEILELVRSRLPKIKYGKKFVREFDERVSLSRKLLKG